MKVWIISSTIRDLASVEKINANLTELYRLLKADIKIINLAYTEGSFPVQQNYNAYFDDLAQSPPDLIVVTHPIVLRQYFFKLLMKTPQSHSIKFIFHIVGDFFRQGHHHLEMEEDLIGKDVHYLFPSSGYMDVTAPNFKNQGEIQKIAIPIDERTFNSSPSARMNTRHELGIKPNEKLFIFTGRISEQKNVPIVLSLVKKYCSENNIPYKFLIAGPFDDFESTSVPVAQRLGKAFHSLKDEFAENIIATYTVDSSVLKNFYNASDLFISLSTYHDESFGLAPLEALLCGTRTLLSGWGGYKDYHTLSRDYCSLIPLTFTHEGFTFSEEQFFEALGDLLSNDYERSNCANKFQAEYSFAKIFKKLNENVLMRKIKFSGFSENFKSIILKRSQNKFNAIPWTQEEYLEEYSAMWSLRK